MNRTYTTVTAGAVLCLVAGGVGADPLATSSSRSVDEVRTWAGQFVRALERRPANDAITFSDPTLNEPGSLPIAQRLIVYRTLIADGTLDPTDIGLNSVEVGSENDVSIEPISRVCNGGVEVIDDPGDVVMFRDFMETGRLTTGTGDPRRVERHIRAALGIAGDQIAFESAQGPSVSDVGLTSQDLRITWMDATMHPASPAGDLGANVASLQKDLKAIVQGISEFGVDRQPSPRSMVSGEMYTNATREIVSLELAGRKDVRVTGIAAVYHDNVLLLTLVETRGAAFLVDGQQSEVFGPYAGGTRLLPAVVDTLWASGRITPGEPVILYSAN